MQLVIGLLLVAIAACLLTWGALRMRDPAAKGWVRKAFAAEFLSILLIATFAAGVGVLVDFVSRQSGDAYAWGIGLVLIVPVLFIGVWRLSGAPARIAGYASAASGGVAANDDGGRGGPRRRAA